MGALVCGHAPIDLASGAPQPADARLAVADCGSFSAAALQLGRQQSSVSHAVRVAERALGTQLFRRHAGGATLTPEGEQVLVHARQAAHALDAMALSAGTGLRGTLRIVSCRSILRHVVTPALPDFLARHPQVQVTLQDTSGEHDEIEAIVSQGKAHLGLGRLPMCADLISVPLLADEYLIISSAQQLPIRTWAELNAARYLLCDEDCAPVIAAHIGRYSHVPQPHLRLRDVGVVLGMVAQGLGYTVLSRLVVTPLAPGLRLQSLPEPLWRTVGIVTTPVCHQHPLVQAFQGGGAQSGRARQPGRCPATEPAHL
ncbi:LysR family transcriptional regulator [Deinococcus oregonensis]|uniref:LysR family transcriptional regulator n=1 Tax=Deinococcus oregonensis TaxID=1805970 RepID=A0ABV6AY02_9DEIO